MSFKSKLNQVRVILGLSINLENAKLVDGTIISAEKFEAGYELSIVAEDGSLSIAPDDVYVTEELTITVTEGLISDVQPVAEVETPEENIIPEVEVPEVVMASEVITPSFTLEEVNSLIDARVNEVMDQVFTVLSEVATEVNSIKENMVSLQEKYSKLSKEPATTVRIPKVQKENTDSNNTLESRIEKLNSLRGV